MAAPRLCQTALPHSPLPRCIRAPLADRKQKRSRWPEGLVVEPHWTATAQVHVGPVAGCSSLRCVGRVVLTGDPPERSRTNYDRHAELSAGSECGLQRPRGRQRGAAGEMPVHRRDRADPNALQLTCPLVPVERTVGLVIHAHADRRIRKLVIHAHADRRARKAETSGVDSVVGREAPASGRRLPHG